METLYKDSIEVERVGFIKARYHKLSIDGEVIHKYPTCDEAIKEYNIIILLLNEGVYWKH